MNAGKKKRIVVLGGGFAGVLCVRKLEEQVADDVEVVMVSEDNFWLFTPMLPQVASGTIETRHVVVPIRTIVKRAVFYEGRVKNIDPYGKIVDLAGTDGRQGASLGYDYLVLAMGSETNFFGMKDIANNAYQMKTLNDAVMLRNRVIDMLERAENEADPILRRSMLTFVIVGGGFAGIETAGELEDLISDVTKHYRNIAREDARVVVLEAGPRILVGFEDSLAEFTLQKLAGRGIDIRLDTAVGSFDGSEVVVRGPEGDSAIQTKTVVWTAGVTPVSTIKRSLFKTKGGKVIVDDHLEVPGFPGVYAVGDCALFIDGERPLPPTAQVAEAEARVAARNILGDMEGRPKEKLAYKSKGQMAVVGQRAGIALFMGVKIYGFPAWLLWRSVYLAKIPNREKRIRVFLDWTIDWIFGRDISRLKFMRRSHEGEPEPDDQDLW